MTDFVSSADGGFIPHARETRSVRGDVPEVLAGRFALVKVIRAAERPSQAVVLRVRRAGAGAEGAPLVLKWYHWMHAPDEKVVRLFGENPGPHLEQLVEEGEAEGHPYLVFRSHGETDLAAHLEENPGALAPGRVEEVARQLHAAVSALHEHEVVHRDITPDNIMVESRRGDALDLVLVDIGVAVHGDGEQTGARRAWRGKPRYLAPEAGPLHQTVSEAGDWWSVGMVLAELALGTHPVDFFSDEAVLREIATHEPDVSGIRDPRTRRLCEGLLTRAPEDRWGAEEVEAWLAGESPAVAGRTRHPAPEAEPPTTVRPFHFLGERFTETEHLARALDLHHLAAAAMLADPEDRAALTDWLGQFETAGGRSPEELRRLAALRDELRSPPSPGTDIRLITWLGPYREASCWGLPLSVEGIRALSRAVRQGDEEALALLRHLTATPETLTVLTRRPRGEGLDETGDRWLALRTRWPHLVRELRRSQGIGRLDRVRRALKQNPAVDARLLELAREPARAAARLEAETATVRGRLATPVPWFDRLTLAGQDDPPLLLVALLLAEHAVREAEELHRRRLDEEIQRLMDEDTDGVVAVMRRMDRLPTLTWALLGATVLMAPWCFVIGLADVLGRASQEAVVVAWLEALPAAAAVFMLELLTAAYIGPPSYHPHRSLAGLLIRTADRPARLVLSRRLRTLLPAAALLLCAVLLGFYAIAVAPWIWPLACVLALGVWSAHRCRVWRRDRRAGLARRAEVRRGHVAARRV
ncbi:protein kinase [Streptomyces sp. KM273126]|uniref:serine/threonine protein kinase n=1 Tax=Streptomyces sp. KM273126 TaxID=2545247 RepID=UPI00103B55DB|nr:protein kinase [Streptomyces sp. KM273126]MBA2807782.1 protein kinase [Streptomyces sp. KM273126]